MQNQKGFISTPFLIIVIISIVIALLGIGVVLENQKESSFISNISQIIETNEGDTGVVKENLKEEPKETEAEFKETTKQTIGGQPEEIGSRQQEEGPAVNIPYITEPAAGSGYPIIDSLCSDKYGCSDQETRPQLRPGDKICVTAYASDPDNDEILYTWITESTGFTSEWSLSNQFCRIVTEEDIGDRKYIAAVIKDKNKYFRMGKYGVDDGADDSKGFNFDVLPPQ